ncbi:MAG: hypothetical protein ACK4GW_05555, partial [Pseudorhodobacter sp.]
IQMTTEMNLALLVRRFGVPRQAAGHVVIVSGAVVGSTVAYWPGEEMRGMLATLVVERDATCGFSAITLSTTANLQGFSSPINGSISQVGMGLIHRNGRLMVPWRSAPRSRVQGT